MNIPAIYQSLQEISLLQGSWLAGLIVAAAFALLWGLRARFALPSWLIFTALLSVQASYLLPAYIAFSVFVVGLFSTLIFYLTARGWPSPRPETGPTNIPLLFFQVLLALFLILILWGLPYQGGFILIANSAEITFLVTSLFALGVFRFVTTTRPLPLGMGILLIISAVGVWQIANLQQPLPLGIWAILVLLTSLMTSFLMQQASRKQSQPILSSSSSETAALAAEETAI